MPLGFNWGTKEKVRLPAQPEPKIEPELTLEDRHEGVRRTVRERVFHISRQVFKYPKEWVSYQHMLVHCDRWERNVVPYDMTIYAPVVMQSPGVRSYFERTVNEALGFGPLVYIWQPTNDVVVIKGLAPVLPSDENAPSHPLQVAGWTKFLLGVSASGKSITWDSKYTPSMVIAGTTQGGKSTGLASLIVGILLSGHKAFIADPKRTEFREFKDAPNVEVHHSVGAIMAMSDRLVAEMESRYDEAAEKGIREEEVASRKGHVYFIVDEWARVVPRSKSDDKQVQEMRRSTENNAKTIASMGAAVGMHVIVATQYPRSDVLDTQILVNCDARVVYGRMTSDASRVVLESEEAAYLPGIHGRGLYRMPRGNLIEFQGYNTTRDQRQEVTDSLIAKAKEARERDHEMARLRLVKVQGNGS